MNYIVLSIPVFFVLIGVELVVQKWRGEKYYRLNDAISNISCGITQQVISALAKTALIILYVVIYENIRVFQFTDTWINWIILFVGVDFFYYWFHRYSHEINFLWGAHIVHHQSEDYNFSVALRQSAFQGFFSMFFYLPLAFLGFNPVAFVAINAFQTLYQFWIHTETIDKMPGFIEYVFNTPSHHRVHHGKNPKYIDKNHGGTLIIFDRLFRTFQAEEEKVIYGVTKPLNTFNPIWANFDYYVDLVILLTRRMSAKERLKIIFGNPGYRPLSQGGKIYPSEIDSKEYQKYNVSMSRKWAIYILFHFGVLLGMVSIFLFSFESYSSVWMVLILSCWIIYSVMSVGMILDGFKKSIAIEILRLITIPVVGWLLFPNILLLVFLVFVVLVSGYILRSGFQGG